MGGVPSPAAAAATGLQGMQVLYDEYLFSGPTYIKSEREGGLGMLGLPGGGGVPRAGRTKGVSLVLLFPENVRNYCLE
jgi:hypothetical protein